jgi:hypothetical protein
MNFYADGVSMIERVFTDQTTELTVITLKAAFEDVYTQFNDLITITGAFSKNWNFSRSSGWILKVHDKKKALFYIIPFNKEFEVSMAIRKNERKQFLMDTELKKIHENLLSAKKYREGYAIRFKSIDVDYDTFKCMIIKLLTIRK